MPGIVPLGMNREIQLICAPSILGLKPSGVELLAETLLNCGLAGRLETTLPILHIPTLNHLYSDVRDSATDCINTEALADFSVTLSNAITPIISQGRFAFVLGGDCSILLGIMSGLKSIGSYGLMFIDAHADFYQPEKSTTGEAADMDLALVTGRGPELLTNINHLKPYVNDGNVIHIGQRDWHETKKYNSQDIKESGIECFDLEMIREKGIEKIVEDVLTRIQSLPLKGFWIHFDTDVLDDAINPAVDYRLPGGLSFAEAEYLLQKLIGTGRMAGISITIFNPKLDRGGSIAENITAMLGRAFR